MTDTRLRTLTRDPGNPDPEHQLRLKAELRRSGTDPHTALANALDACRAKVADRIIRTRNFPIIQARTLTLGQVLRLERNERAWAALSRSIAAASQAGSFASALVSTTTRALQELAEVARLIGHPPLDATPTPLLPSPHHERQPPPLQPRSHPTEDPPPGP